MIANSNVTKTLSLFNTLNDQELRDFYAHVLKPENGSHQDQETHELSLPTWADIVELIGPIEWDWQDWLPRGLLTILASESGIGKSALILRVAHTYIDGMPWPDGSAYKGKVGSVLWCESEAAQAINLQRAQAWGIPLDRLKTPIFENALDDFKLDDAFHKGALAFAAMQDDIRLVIIDSLSGADSRVEKSTEDASNVKWLAELARDFWKAGSCVPSPS